MTNQISYNQTEVIAKGATLNIAGTEYYIYNETQIGLHMVKLGAKGQVLSIRNKSNLCTMTREQVLRFIGISSISVSVGVVPA